MALTAIDRLVLDTSAYSHLCRGHADVLDAIARASLVLVPVTVLGELHAAFAIGSRRDANEQVLDTFLSEPFVEVLALGPAAAARYGDIVSALRRAGTPIPTNDIWIAAQALDAGGHLVTFDRDFERVPGLPHTCLKPV